ncbi:hypothetical protein K7X08_035656 [Anisodus acutangulus]|uniref:Uncharacterized protein n=1 Tax=Anisodus acutangulus TaxID=402998 RepID=A0A9Q1R0U5_9SOLA|nr:hypothetical protein K7X08_035656 [Anisodus acutangulus]
MLEVVRSFLYPNDAKKSKNYIKILVYYDDEVPNPNIDALKREIGDTHQFRVKMKLASGSGHERDYDEDQVQEYLGGRAKETYDYYGRGPSVIADRLTSIEDELVSIRKLLEKKPRRHSKCISFSVRSSRKRIRKTLKFANGKKTKVNALDGSLLSHPDHVDDAHNVSFSPFTDQVDDGSCKTLPLTDPAHAHNDDDPSSPLPDKVDDASCKTLPGEVVNSAVYSEHRSPDGRITDVYHRYMSRMTLKSLEMLLKMAIRLQMKKLFE